MLRIDAAVDHPDPLPVDPALDEVVGRALADRLERHATVDPRNRALSQPHRGRQRQRQLLEHRRPEQVRHHRHHRDLAPARRVKRHLVDVFDQHVERPVGEMLAGTRRARAIERCFACRPGRPRCRRAQRGAHTRASRRTACSPRGRAPPAVRRSRAGESRRPPPAGFSRSCQFTRRIRNQILPRRRARASSTPLTKRALSSVPNRSAR